MNAYVLDDETLLVPRAAIIDDPELGEIIGDGMAKIGKDDPQYEEWLPFALVLPAAMRVHLNKL